MTKTIRIGCAIGLLGRQLHRGAAAGRRGARLPRFDYLAEITMSIMARQREKDPKARLRHDSSPSR